MTQTAFIALTAVAISVAGCGGDDGETPAGVPTDSPEAVVEAHIEALADCGEEAARRLVESSTANSEGLSDEEAVQRILDEQSEQGCTPQPTGEIETFVVEQSGDVATVEARIPEGDLAGTEQLRVLRTDEGWKVDASTDE